MLVVIGSDHAGYLLKEEVMKYLNEKGIEVLDKGTNSSESVDYPDFAHAVCESVIENDCFGILICYTGIGMSMAANKHKNIRAALVSIVEDAILTREHNNANVLCLSAKNLTVSNATTIVDAFLNTEFAGGRHERRVNKIEVL